MTAVSQFRGVKRTMLLVNDVVVISHATRDRRAVPMRQDRHSDNGQKGSSHATRQTFGQWPERQFSCDKTDSRLRPRETTRVRRATPMRQMTDIRFPCDKDRTGNSQLPKSTCTHPIRSSRKREVSSTQELAPREYASEGNDCQDG